MVDRAESISRPFSLLQMPTGQQGTGLLSSHVASSSTSTSSVFISGYAGKRYLGSRLCNWGTQGIKLPWSKLCLCPRFLALTGTGPKWLRRYETKKMVPPAESNLGQRREFYGFREREQGQYWVATISGCPLILQRVSGRGSRCTWGTKVKMCVCQYAQIGLFIPILI